jgi:hypothetical protein
MNKTYLGVGILILATIAGLCFVLVDEQVIEPVPEEPVEIATSTPTVATTTEDAEIIALIEADIASNEERTLEITGWRKMNDDQYLQQNNYEIEVWYPDNWFTDGSYDGGRGSQVPLFRKPKGVVDITTNRDLIREHKFDLSIGDIEFSIYTTPRVLQYNQEKLEEGQPQTSFVSFKDDVTTVIIDGHEAQKIARTFTKEDGIQVTSYSVVLQYSFDYYEGDTSNLNLDELAEIYSEYSPDQYLAISVSGYTNSEEVLDEMISRIRITKSSN